MPQQILQTIENNFTKGLITESTGLNFPENAATDTDNSEYTLIGDVIRREGIDIEINGVANSVSRVNAAISTYKWDNVEGDGETQIVVEQVGSTLYFYKSSSATVAQPLSTQLLTVTLNLLSFTVSGEVFDSTVECQYTDGNGYLFVFHPNCDPFYCTYSSSTRTVTGTSISVQIRDFTGIYEPGVPVNLRPSILTNEHEYNLSNQGWTQGSAWAVFSASNVTVQAGVVNFYAPTGVPINNGDRVVCVNNHPASPGGSYYAGGSIIMVGNVVSYVGNTLSINIAYVDPGWLGSNYSDWQIRPVGTGFISIWNTAIGNYPSNSDVYWYFRDSTGAFNPATTIGNVNYNLGNAPQGHYTLNAFNQKRSQISGLTGLTNISTSARPSTGVWFLGRLWFTGVNSSQQATGDAAFYTWSENIYFSQISLSNANNFGSCFQVNDPTSDKLNSLLPDDGGVIQIQGCGRIYKLVPVFNALLVFAANGVWYIAGNQGPGFTADDYTIVKLSSVRSISSTSFVIIPGDSLPFFWNEEGIYQVSRAKQGTQLLNSPVHVQPLTVDPLTLGTILSFYKTIPLQSKKYARGVYDPINYKIQWLYRDIEETDVTSRYTFNKILNYNTHNNAFFPYTINASNISINSIVYVASPGGLNTPSPTIKYIASNTSNMYFADEHDTSYIDWASQSPVNYTSYFVTGYKIRGQAIRKFQPQYVQVHYRTNGTVAAYNFQGVWDAANNRNSNRWSSLQQVYNYDNNYDFKSKRHKLRGHGYALQFKVSSVDGEPFDIIGWSVIDLVNSGV